MKKRNKILLILLGIVILSVLLLYLTTPIMLTSQGMVSRQKVNKFEDMYVLDNTVKRFSLKNERYLVFLHFGLNDSVKIYTEDGEKAFTKKGPFMWVEKLENIGYAVYKVEINDDKKYYFMYLAP